MKTLCLLLCLAVTAAAAADLNLRMGGQLTVGSQITVTGNATFEPGATFRPKIANAVPVTGYGQLRVNGGVSLGGATLSLGGAYVPQPGNSFTLIDNDGTADGVSGTFAGLAEGASTTFNGVALTISYAGGDGNDVVLTSAPGPSPLVGAVPGGGPALDRQAGTGPGSASGKVGRGQPTSDGRVASAIAGGPPAFSAGFSPSTIGPGSVSTLTFQISNVEPVPIDNLVFTATLPAGVIIAVPANASTDCPQAILSAPDGGTTFTFSNGRLGVGASCSVKVNVTSATPGTHMFASSPLTSSAPSGGPATADLTVSTDRPGFTMSFSPSTIAVGGVSTLTFTIDNTANTSNASSPAFDHILPDGLFIATLSNAAGTVIGGTLTADPGTRTVSLTGGFVAANSIATVTVDVTATKPGVFRNVSDELTAADALFVVRSSGRAGAVLNVPAGFLTATFIDDPLPPGGTGTLRFTLTNLFPGEASGLAFTCDLGAVLTGFVAVSLPPNPCGPGSQISGTSLLTFTGGTLAPGAARSFDIPVRVPANAADGIYPLTTSVLTGTIAAGSDDNGRETAGGPLNIAGGSDQLVINSAPVLTMEFIDDPIGSGSTATLRFTVTNTSATSPAIDVTFAVSLPTFLPIPDSFTPPPGGFLGQGSTMSVLGQELLVEAGSLAAGASQSFDLIIDTHAGMPGGVHTITSPGISASVDGQTVSGPGVTADLLVATAPQLTMRFTDDPVLPGGTATLEFTLSHGEEAIGPATGITFNLDLAAVAPGLTVGLPPLPDPPCGPGSSATATAGDTLLTLVGGTLAPGESRTFAVLVNVGASVPFGSHTATTSGLSATVDGTPVAGNAASDALDINSLKFSKSFVNDPVIPGGTVTLRYVIENRSPTLAATDIFFTDNLSSIIAGLAAVAPLPGEPCGAGSSLAGTSLLLLTGGSLAPGQTCTFDVTLLVPTTATPGTGAEPAAYVSVSSNLSATVDGAPVIVNVATDTLLVISASLPVDFGDAPDPTYPTLLASNGARHAIAAGFFLGTGISAEADGQPGATATGDDLDDGVLFTSSIIPGNNATVTVTASEPGKLDAWIDFNADETWEAAEQIFADAPLAAGANLLTYPVPAGAVPGPATFARFRFSSAGGLSPSGYAGDGEVEDYAVSIRGATARDDFAFTTGRKAIDIDVLANDVPGVIALSILTPPQHGTATVVNGKVRYIPNGLLPPGGDTFTYQYDDGMGGIGTATVTIVNFTAIAGSFDGLIADPTAAPGAGGHHRAGHLRVTISRTGSFSGALTFGGMKLSAIFRAGFQGFGFGSTLGSAGEGMRVVVRRPQAPITLTLRFDAATATILGTAESTDSAGMAFTSEFVLAAQTPAGAQAGQYTLLVEPTDVINGPIVAGAPGVLPIQAVPAGTGYAAVTIRPAGQVVLRGRLADGAPFTSATAFHPDNSFPIYARLYRGAFDRRGSLRGTMQFRTRVVNTAPPNGVRVFAGDAQGVLDWFKPELPLDAYFPDGFGLTRPAVLARYERPARGIRVIDLAPVAENGRLLLDQGGLPAIDRVFTLAANNRAIASPPNPEQVLLRFDLSTGLFGGRFFHPVRGRSTIFGGAIFQNAVFGAGFFLGPGPTDGGAVEIGVNR